MLRRGQPDSRESCIVLQSRLTRSLVANFRSIRSLLAVCKFCATGEERCEWGYGQMCANLWCLTSWHPKRIRIITAMWAQRIYLWIHYAKFSMVGGYTENLEKSQNWRWMYLTCMSSLLVCFLRLRWTTCLMSEFNKCAWMSELYL